MARHGAGHGAAGPPAVIFDVGRVLFHWDLRLLFAKLIDDPAELDWFTANVVTPAWHFQHDAGRDLDPMIAELVDRYPAQAPLIAAYRARFNETIPGPVAGMPALVETLYAAGVPLFIITNFGEELWRGFRPTQPLFDRFDGILVSGAEKLAKPDPAIYRLALDRFGIAAADALFVDDLAANVAGARSVGIRAHQFVDAADTRRWLAREGVLPAQRA